MADQASISIKISEGQLYVDGKHVGKMVSCDLDVGEVVYFAIVPDEPDWHTALPIALNEHVGSTDPRLPESDSNPSDG